MSKLDEEKLIEAFIADWRDYLRSARTLHANEQWYAFYAVGGDDFFGLSPLLLGKSKILSEFEEQAAKAGADARHLANDEWYSPSFGYWDIEHSREVDSVLAPIGDPYALSEAGYQSFMERYLACAERALKLLDEEGEFGTGDERDKIVISIRSLDQSDRSIRELARAVNPASALTAYESLLSVEDPVGEFEWLGEDPVYQVNDMAVSPSGEFIAVCGSGFIEVWNYPSRLRVARMRTRGKKGRGDSWCLAISDDGYVYASDDAKIRCWKVPSSTGKGRHKELEPLSLFPKQVNGVALSNDREFLFAGDWESNLIAFDLNQNEVRWTAKEDGKWLLVSPAGKYVARTGSNRPIIRDAASGKPVHTPAMPCDSLAFSGDDTIVVGAEWNLTKGERAESSDIVAYSISDESVVARFSLPDRCIGALALSPSAELVAASTGSGWICVWTFPKFEPVMRVRGRQESITSLLFLDGGKTLAASGRDVDCGPPVYLWAVPR